MKWKLTEDRDKKGRFITGSDMTRRFITGNDMTGRFIEDNDMSERLRTGSDMTMKLIPDRAVSRREAADYRSRQVKYQKLAIALITLVVIVCGSLLGSAILAASRSEASQEPPSFKYYTCIEIRPGDTLWSIAAAYMSPEYDSVQDYIEEVKALNQLGPDDIHSGQFLTIPYYSREFR